MAVDYDAVWAGHLDQILQLTDLDAAKSALQSAFVSFRRCPFCDLHSWVTASMSLFASPAAAHLFQPFIEISLTEFSRWLLEDPDLHLDAFIDFLATSLAPEHRIDFVTFLADLLAQLLARAGDMNFLLAIQAPVFAYCVAGHPDSQAVCERWFHSLTASRGADIFGDDLAAALAYFKIMSHAFLQVSVTTATGIAQDPTMIAVQDTMHETVAAISQMLDP
jgi:hypothetical protein